MLLATGVLTIPSSIKLLHLPPHYPEINPSKDICTKFMATNELEYGGDTDGNALYSLMLGHNQVGKSCLIIRYCSGEFIENVDIDIDDAFRKMTVIPKNHKILWDILDPYPSAMEFKAMTSQWIRQSSVIFLMVSPIRLKQWELTFKESMQVYLKMVQENPLCRLDKYD